MSSTCHFVNEYWASPSDGRDMLYAVEIGGWGNWELEREFNTISEAARYAGRNLPRENWRVVERRTGRVVYDRHDRTLSALREVQPLFYPARYGDETVNTWIVPFRYVSEEEPTFEINWKVAGF